MITIPDKNEMMNDREGALEDEIKGDGRERLSPNWMRIMKTKQYFYIVKI